MEPKNMVKAIVFPVVIAGAACVVSGLPAKLRGNWKQRHPDVYESVGVKDGHEYFVKKLQDEPQPEYQIVEKDGKEALAGYTFQSQFAARNTIAYAQAQHKSLEDAARSIDDTNNTDNIGHVLDGEVQNAYAKLRKQKLF